MIDLIARKVIYIAFISFVAVSCSDNSLTPSEREIALLDVNNSSSEARSYQNEFSYLAVVASSYKDMIVENRTRMENNSFCADNLDLSGIDSMYDEVCAPYDFKSDVRKEWGTSREECLEKAMVSKSHLRNEGVSFIGPKLQNVIDYYDEVICKEYYDDAIEEKTSKNETYELEPKQANFNCDSKWARSESFGGSYGEAMMGIQMSAPECYCQADFNKVMAMGPEASSSYLSQCKR